jgi:hypothetical protein
MYLEKSNEQLMADLRQSKLTLDLVEREKDNQTKQIADLMQEND